MLYGRTVLERMLQGNCIFVEYDYVFISFKVLTRSLSV